MTWSLNISAKKISREPPADLFLQILSLQKRHDPIHHHKVAHTAQEDKDVENLVATKAGIVPARPFDGVKYAAHRV
jgi:hypothetical protein